MPVDAIVLMPFDEEYKLLPDSFVGDVEGPADVILPDSDLATARRRRHRMLFAIHYLLIAVLSVALLWLFSQYRTLRSQLSPLQVYSPANEAIEYEDIVFNGDFPPSSVYVRYPSDEVDKAWLDLYNEFGLSQLSKSQALRLVNKTLPIPADPDHYILSVSVFHQLHCLNNIRKALHPEYYVDPVTGALGDLPKDEITDHINHCIDSLRQSLMCASDVSPIVFQWDASRGRAVPTMSTLRTCRKFDKIASWAKAHRMHHHFDHSIHVPDA